MTVLGELIRQCVAEQEQQASFVRQEYLAKLPTNTFRAIYEAYEDVWAGGLYNGIYYGEFEIYYASLARDEGYPTLL